MPKYISKKQLIVINNLAEDLGFNQSINPEFFNYITNTFYEVKFSMPHNSGEQDQCIRTVIEFPISKELKKRFPNEKREWVELKLDMTFEDYEELGEWENYSQICLHHELEKIDSIFKSMSNTVKKELN